MNNMTQTEWQKSLKPGDEVHVYGITCDKLCQVETVTADGTVMAGGHIFNPSGCEAKTGRLPNVWIGPVTEENRHEFLKRQLSNQIKNCKFDQLSLAKLERIKQIIEE